jgi:hypothetical protein
MHRLEYLLLVLSERIRRETGNADLANAAGHLAGASADYEPCIGQDGTSADEHHLATMHKDWQRKFGDLLHK